MSENISQAKVKAYCFKVPKHLGERAIKVASRLNLLERNLKVHRIENYVFIPLKGEPSEKQISEFEKEITQFEILIHDFIRREETVRSIIDVLEDKMPPHLLASLPRSIDFVGDLAILEIPEELENYKWLIGEAVLKVFKNVRSVLAKSSAIKGVYRVREYEIIAGSENTETLHREYGCKYLLDPRKVYFSPRLSYEHHRVASQVNEGEIIIDMFAGVGPFSILIAKTHKNVKVYSIDINPNAIEYLKRNIYLNGVHDKVIPIFGDAREIIQRELHETADRVIMNLPEKAIEYIDAACVALKQLGGIIHFYGFSRGPYAINEIKNQLVELISKFGRKVEAVISERIIKEVAPYKWQVAIDVKVK
jgi:tRNA (guanine37-N1)-methyltransferase